MHCLDRSKPNEVLKPRVVHAAMEREGKWNDGTSSVRESWSGSFDAAAQGNSLPLNGE